MSITITLTDAIRSYSYFSGFSEESVVIPNKPFIQEILSEKLLFELLSTEDLQKCIETCVYFGLDGTRLIQEFFWSAARTEEIFALYFNCTIQNDDEKSEIDSESSISVYSIRSEIPNPLRSELIASWGEKLDRQKLIQLGARFLHPSCVEIAASGNLRLLRWFVGEDSSDDEKEVPFMWNEECPSSAAEEGHLEMLQYLHQNGCPWNQGICSPFTEKRPSWRQRMDFWKDKCHPNEWVCTAAARGGHLTCLKYARENGCHWERETCYEAATGGTEGHLECLKYAHENGCPWDEHVYGVAAKQGHLECLKYLQKNRCPWSGDICSLAASGNTERHVACLKYLRENGHPWNTLICGAAAFSGSYVCLKYLHENGCPWSITTCSNSARGGRLECLKYAHESGCSWGVDTCKAAAEEGHLECLKYAHENGCPWDEDTCEAAVENNHQECLEYARANGCPDRTTSKRHRNGR